MAVNHSFSGLFVLFLFSFLCARAIFGLLFFLRRLPHLPDGEPPKPTQVTSVFFKAWLQNLSPKCSVAFLPDLSTFYMSELIDGNYFRILLPGYSLPLSTYRYVQ